MRPRPLPAWDDLALHCLALVPGPAPGDLHDPRYAAWCARHLPDDAWRPVVDVAPALGRLLADAGAEGHCLHLAARAWPDAAALARDARDDAPFPPPLRRLARAHAALAGAFRASAALVARAWERAWPDAVAPHLDAAARACAPVMADACQRLPGLAGLDVGLSFALGPRGRALGGDVVVGAPSPWSPHDPAHAAAMALHERAVSLAGEALEASGAEAGWAARERVALEAVGASLRGGALAAAWARWRAGLDLTVVGRARAGREAGAVASVALALRRPSR